MPDLVATSPGGDLIAICYGAASPVCSTLHVNNTTNYGHSVTTNGDYNLDGFSDVWFGLETSTGDYRAQLCLGTSTRGILNCTGTIDADLPTDPLSWLGDVDGDGFDDLVLGRLLLDGADIIFTNGGAGYSQLRLTEATFGFPATDLGLAVAGPGDVNNDGYADYMIGGGYALMIYGTPTGIPVNYVSRDSSLGSHGRGLSAGDFDGDGDKDLVWVGSGFGEIFDATPTGYTRTQVLTYPGTRWGDGGVTAPFDLGDDGDLNVVVGTFNGYAAVLSPAADDDGDGYFVGDDCNDSVASINPGAAEVTGDEVDQNCDGAERCFADVDRDGSRDSLATTPSSDLDCRDPGEARTGAPLDCDDSSDDYEVTCPPLRLTVSSPAVAGQPATIAVEGAPIGGRVYVVRGSTTGTTAFGCVTVNLRNVSVITDRAADASGRVSITPTLPAGLAGTTQNLQAAVPAACDVSNRVTFSVQ